MNGAILVVDDEPNTRDSLADILRLEGYQVETAANGEEALVQLGQGAGTQVRPFDIMLLDIIMPGVDGMEVLRQAAQISPQTLIILLTAHGSMESAIEALRYGAHDYLLKPASPPEMITSISRAMEHLNEHQHKRRLLEQMENSIHLLKNAEGMEQTPVMKAAVATVGKGIKVDLERREIWHGETKVQLTPTEGKLMKILIENQGRVLSHRELVLLVQGYTTTDWEAPEILRPLVSRLRRKLAIFEGGADWISNVRGTGYVFEEEK